MKAQRCLACRVGGDTDLLALVAEYRRQEREMNMPKGRSDEEVDRLSAELRAVRDRLDKVRPATLRGALAVLDLGELAVLDLGELIDDPDWWPDNGIEGLRKIVETEARQ